MPGVTVVTTTARAGSIGLADPSGQLFIAGLTERGDTVNPMLLGGMSDALSLLGNRVSYGFVYDQLAAFFAEGGTQAYVSRVVGPAASVGTLTLSDRGTTVQPTVRVNASSEGAWSANTSVLISAGTRTNSFQISVFYNGVEVVNYNNLTSIAAAVSASAGNAYVALTDLGSTNTGISAFPALSAGGTAVPLSAGIDDRGSVTSDTYVAGLDAFSLGLGDGAVAIPGLGSSVHAGIMAHCVANNRVALLSDDQGASVADLSTLAAGYDIEYAGLFAPWVLISDGAGGTIAISPEGFVAAKRAVAHATVGAWSVPAGAAGVANGGSAGIIGLDQSFDSVDGNALDSANVSAIRFIANSVRLYGWKSLSQDQSDYALLSTRDELNRIVTLCQQALETYVFQTIDSSGHLLASINGELVGILQPIADAGGLYPLLNATTGIQIDPGYEVDTGTSVNSVLSLATNLVRAVVSVRISPTGSAIQLTIVSTNVTNGF